MISQSNPLQGDSVLAFKHTLQIITKEMETLKEEKANYELIAKTHLRYAKQFESVSLDVFREAYPGEDDISLMARTILSRINVISNAFYTVSDPSSSFQRWEMINESLHKIADFFLKDTRKAQEAFNKLSKEARVQLRCILNLIHINPDYRSQVHFFDQNKETMQPIIPFLNYMEETLNRKELQGIVTEVNKKILKKIGAVEAQKMEQKAGEVLKEFISKNPREAKSLLAQMSQPMSLNKKKPPASKPSFFRPWAGMGAAGVALALGSGVGPAITFGLTFILLNGGVELMKEQCCASRRPKR